MSKPEQLTDEEQTLLNLIREENRKLEDSINESIETMKCELRIGISEIEKRLGNIKHRLDNADQKFSNLKQSLEIVKDNVEVIANELAHRKDSEGD